MKTMATLIGLAVTALVVAAMLLAALIELLMKLVIPISIGVAVWLIVRARRRNQQPAPIAANQPDLPQVDEQSVTAAPALAPAPVQAVPALPPVLAHQHRSYVVVGRDSGFTAQAPGGYLRVDSPSSCAPIPVDHSALVARHLGRRPSRARSTRP